MVASKKEEIMTTDAPGSESLPRVKAKHVFREWPRPRGQSSPADDNPHHRFYLDQIDEPRARA
jgi:hypothetical protein